ncbi:MAG: DUF2235 domain-containing protein, partial [Afipia sp.]|nr:DUF2235 domain-containing protein [Afipia sp.]
RYRLGGEPKTIRALHDEAVRGHIPASNEERWLLKYSQPIDVDFIGVWDTVGAVTKKETQFLHTGLRLPIQYAFHALALDEHRRRFAPTLWTVDVPKDAKVSIAKPRTLEQVEQRWFAGAHANIGGGYPDDLLAQLPLKWLLEKAALQGLAFRANVDLDGDPTKSPVIDSTDSSHCSSHSIGRSRKRQRTRLPDAATSTRQLTHQYFNDGQKTNCTGRKTWLNGRNGTNSIFQRLPDLSMRMIQQKPFNRLRHEPRLRRKTQRQTAG